MFTYCFVQFANCVYVCTIIQCWSSDGYHVWMLRRSSVSHNAIGDHVSSEEDHLSQDPSHASSRRDTNHDMEILVMQFVKNSIVNNPIIVSRTFKIVLSSGVTPNFMFSLFQILKTLVNPLETLLTTFSQLSQSFRWIMFDDLFLLGYKVKAEISQKNSHYRYATLITIPRFNHLQIANKYLNSVNKLNNGITSNCFSTYILHSFNITTTSYYALLCHFSPIIITCFYKDQTGYISIVVEAWLLMTTV